eukprot:COSAG02_NODE_20328_length_837_cov_0.987805_1_plen_20_part_01
MWHAADVAARTLLVLAVGVS